MESTAASTPSCRDAVRSAMRGAQSDDAQLVEAVRASQRTVLGYFFDFEARRETPPVAQPTAETDLPAGAARARQLDRARAARRRRRTQNLPELTSAARGLGYFNFFPDADGIFRRVPLAIRFGDRIAMPLSLAMLQLYWPDRPAAIRFGPSGVESVRLGAARPAGRGGRTDCWSTTAGRAARSATSRRPTCWPGACPPDTFRDKLVLVGVTAVGA